MTAIASHVTAFFQQRLTLERRASANTCDSYAYAFKMLLGYASNRLKTAPSRLELEQIDAPMVVSFLNHLESARTNGASSRNVRLAAIKSFMRFIEYRVPSALEQTQRILAIPMKKTDSRLVQHLSTEEIQHFWMHPNRSIGQAFGTVRCCTCVSLPDCGSQNS
jgi:integrase/recombinase XerD